MNQLEIRAKVLKAGTRLPLNRLRMNFFLIGYMPPIDRFIVVILAAGGTPARKSRVAPEMTLRVGITSWIPAFARMTAFRDM